MIDKNLRSLERFQDQDPLKLKLLQRRLRMGVYIQEAPRPIKVFNDTELLINISKENKDGYGSGHGSGHGDGDGNGHGHGYRDGDGFGSGFKDGNGVGFGYGYGLGSGSGESEYSYTRRLREKYD